MRRITAFLLLTAFISGSISCRSRSQVEEPANPQTAAQYLGQADQLYSQRADLNRIREAVIILRQATTTDPGNFDAAWRLAKFNYYLGTHTDNSTERDKAFRDGIEAGKAAVRLQEGKPDGHFWLGANYGGSAQSSTLAGLATVADISGEMETVIRLDKGYQNGSAYMVLGLVYLQAPRMIGGDPQKAVEQMEKGLPLGPTNAFLRLHLAEAYLKVGRKADARQQLTAIISMTPEQDYLPEYNEAVAAAHKLMDQTGES